MTPIYPVYAAGATAAGVCASTLAGSLMARRGARRMTLWLLITSGLILVVALTEVLPDAWLDALRDRVPTAQIVVAAALGYAAVSLLTRREHHGHPLVRLRSRRPGGRHAPGQHRQVRPATQMMFGGVGTAMALASHRTIESAAVAMTTSSMIVVSLLVHSASEGLTLTALLDTARQRLRPWLLLACVSPTVGALVGLVVPLPAHAIPILLAIAAGELVHTALLGLKLALHRNGGRPPQRHRAVAALTVLLVAAPLILARTGGSLIAPDGPGTPAALRDHSTATAGLPGVPGSPSASGRSLTPGPDADPAPTRGPVPSPHESDRRGHHQHRRSHRKRTRRRSGGRTSRRPARRTARDRRRRRVT
ncbi:hypothetical protein J4573_22065 [Actinomadura barringtoniae]|uniref:ZIP family metal transporter n=1 Tax=Actinomadura barringtoniae TaxID=1427535 RepID=A0A939PCD6_9ACTN|nr:hypothetical protein [Actinomadura barringtoniae]MBO2449803.1 hypothetical protein [Actinomadura barringtoniae]